MEGKIIYTPIYHPENQPGSERSDKAREWFDKIFIPQGRASLDKRLSNTYFVATGDSGFMGAARTRYADHKIFVGMNCGRLGFLSNNFKTIKNVPLDFKQLNIFDLKLLKATFFLRNGKIIEHLAFNEVVIGESVSDFITFNIKGTLRHFPRRKSLGTGVFVSTAQGTTGYALRARGSAALLPLDSSSWFIGGIATGPYPCDQVMPQDILIEVSARTKVNCYADGKKQKVKDVYQVLISPTDITVSIGFIKGVDFLAKRTRLAQKIERGG